MNQQIVLWAAFVFVIGLFRDVVAYKGGTSDTADCLKSIGLRKCYTCSARSTESPCADPFNETAVNRVGGMKLEVCSELGDVCTKWTRRPTDETYSIIRGCASNLTIKKLSVHHGICMSESRPSTGLICFCHKDRCNLSTLPSPAGWIVTFVLTTLLTLYFLNSR